jgi:CO dehydrogenase maturation factor
LTVNIAVAGKGGTGKTSVTSLVIRYLVRRTLGTVLAIDADPNANLAEDLGLDVKLTVVKIVDEFHRLTVKIPPGMTKESYLEYQLNAAVSDTRGLDLITMGRGESAEYFSSYPDVFIRNLIDDWAKIYDFVVIDNEAGMEHLGRRPNWHIDEMLLVSDHSTKGIRLVARMRDVIKEMHLAIARESVIVNMVPGDIDPLLKQEMDIFRIAPAAIIPFDEEIKKFEFAQKPLFQLPDTSVAVIAVNKLMDKLVRKTKVPA